MHFRARRFDTGEVCSIRVFDARIVELTPASPSGDESWIAPGFVDLQINGFGGVEFTDERLEVEPIEQVSRACGAMGVTRFCATVTTHRIEAMIDAVRRIDLACRQSRIAESRIAAIHLEGPYISREDGPRGAHPAAHCRPPDWDEFSRIQEAAGGRIRLLTMSPEYPGSGDFIARVVRSGVAVAIGHTNADSTQIREAADCGATLSTHLGNGAHATLRRHPNYIWDQLAEDRLTATLIVDGHHLPAPVVKSFVRAKSPERCILVSDLVGLGGKPPGVYPVAKAGLIEVLDDGRLVVAGQRQYLYGAGLSLTFGIANVMRFAGVDLKTAVEMATVRPARVLGLESSLSAQSPADLVLFDLPDDSGPLRIRATLQSGEVVYGELPSADGMSSEPIAR